MNDQTSVVNIATLAGLHVGPASGSRPTINFFASLYTAVKIPALPHFRRKGSQ